MWLATEAHLKARQRLDLLSGPCSKILPTHGPSDVGQDVWYWGRDMSKIRGGEWLRAKVLESRPTNPMVKIELTEDRRCRVLLRCLGCQLDLVKS